jgi:transcriptional regulator with XRE-family HTH domain
MIRKRRLDLGLPQVDVAKTVGCDELTVVNWEKGHSSARVNHLARVADFLGFNPCALDSNQNSSDALP